MNLPNECLDNMIAILMCVLEKEYRSEHFEAYKEYHQLTLILCAIILDRKLYVLLERL